MSTAVHTEHATTDLREYVRVIRSRKWSILLITLLMVGAAVLYSARQTPIYRGSARLVLLPQISAAQSNGNVSKAAPDPNTEKEVVASAPVATQVQQDLHITTPVGTLLKHLDVSVVQNSNVLQVSYNDPKPAVSATLANAFANGYIHYKFATAQQQYQAAQAPIKAALDTLGKQSANLGAQIARLPATSPLAQSLISQRNQIDSQRGVLQVQLTHIPAPQQAGQVTAPATPPASPYSPKWVRNILIALVAGLVLGIGIAFAREAMDDKIKTREELERRIG